MARPGRRSPLASLATTSPGSSAKIPTRKGFLYAGTETGIYLSADDGATWQRLGGNFPVVPVHDMVLTQGDLVVGTHGRSFWIFDDVTILHQLADAAAEEKAAKLLTPRDTIRYGRMHGFGHSPVSGKNFAFAAGMIPAFYQKKDPDGQTKSTWIDAGTNPPDGVILHYTLPEEPAEPITLAFLDAEGNEIRSFKSKKKDEEPAAPSETTGSASTAAEPGTPMGSAASGEDTRPDQDTEEKDEEPTVPAKAGLNRYVWNARYDDATKIATKGGDQPGRSGPSAAPGTYEARLTVGDQTESATFQILPDPRLTVSDADLNAQFALGLQIRDKHSEINEAINRIRSIREQAELWTKRSKDLDGGEAIKDAAKALGKKLDEIEGELIQKDAKSSQDTLNFPVKLNSKLAALGNSVGAGDTAPTKQQQDLFADLAARIAVHLDALKALEQDDVAAFNALVRDAALPAITPVSSGDKKD